MRIKYILFFFALWFANTNVFGQELLTLQDAIGIALKNNYEINLVKNDAEISKNNVNLGNAGLLPTAIGTFRTGGSRQNTVQTQSTGTQRITDGAKSKNLSYGVGLGWTVFDGFKMFANLDRLKALEEQGKVNLKSSILTTIADVFSAYYTIAKQQQLVVASDSAIDVSNFRLRIADNKLAIGKGSKLDVLAAQVDYNSDTSNYLQQKNLLRIYMVNLNQLLARDPTIKFSVPFKIEIDKNLNYNELVVQSATLNTDLQIAFINKKIADLNLKQIKADRYPQINLNTGYDFNRNTSPTGFNTSFKANGLTYGITASMNIFNGFLQRQNERNAKIEINSSELSFNKVKQDVTAQIATTFQNYMTYIDLIKLEGKNIEIANQNLDITLDKYRLGSITPIILREAQKNAISAISRYVEIQYQAKLAEIKLKELSGTLNIQ